MDILETPPSMNHLPEISSINEHGGAFLIPNITLEPEIDTTTVKESTTFEILTPETSSTTTTLTTELIILKNQNSTIKPELNATDWAERNSHKNKQEKFENKYTQRSDNTLTWLIISTILIGILL